MKEFWKKLVAILYESELNKIRGSPIYKQPDNKEKEKASDSDIEELFNPNQQDSAVADKERCTLPASMVPAAPPDLDEIVKYIMSIKDAKCLE